MSLHALLRSDGAAPAAEPATGDRRATWLELFFDLVFAAAVADAGAAFSGDYSVAGLARFGFIFFLIWWAWIGHTLFATRFDNDDLGQRLLTLGQVFAVAVMSVNTRTDMASREAAGFAAAYGGMRLLLAVQYLRVLRAAGSGRFASRQAAGIAGAAAVWLASSLAPPPLRFGLFALALGIDLLTPLWALRAGRRIPPHPAHLPERFGLFTLILLGESVIGVMAGMRHQEHWTAGAGSSAVLGMGLTFALWWAYFDVVGGAEPKPVRTAAELRRLRIWATAHLPLLFGIAVGAVGLERVIDAGGVEPLGRSGAALLAGGVGLTVLALGVIAAAGPALAGRWRLIRRSLGVHLGAAAGIGALAGPFAGRPPLMLLAGLVGMVLATAALEARGRVTAG